MVVPSASRWPKHTVSEDYAVSLFEAARTATITLFFVATWIVYKVSGKATTKQEAVDLLSAMGEISRATHLDERMRLALRLPPAIVVQFKMYDPKRDIEKVSWL